MSRVCSCFQLCCSCSVDIVSLLSGDVAVLRRISYVFMEENSNKNPQQPQLGEENKENKQTTVIRKRDSLICIEIHVVSLETTIATLQFNLY